MFVLFAVLSNVFLSSPHEVQEAYEARVAAHPEHRSFLTGQTEGHLAYQVVAKAVYCTFHKERLEGKKVLRYPIEKSEELSDFFRTFSLVKEFDLTLSRVSDYLVAVSPCIQESALNESALAIFLANERKEEVEALIRAIFRIEKVSPHIFEKYLAELIASCPRSGEAGILTQVFLPKGKALEKVVYPCAPFGMPTDAKKPSQYRLLPSGMTKENGFDLKEIPMYRYTLVKEEALTAYKKRVQAIVARIYQEHLQDNASIEREESIARKIQKYLDKNDWEKAEQLIERHKLLHLYPSLFECLQRNHQMERMEALIPHLQGEKEPFWVQLAFDYLTGYGNFSKLEQILAHRPEGEGKNFLLLTAAYLADDKESYFGRVNHCYSCDYQTLMVKFLN